MCNYVDILFFGMIKISEVKVHLVKIVSTCPVSPTGPLCGESTGYRWIPHRRYQ